MHKRGVVTAAVAGVCLVSALTVPLVPKLRMGAALVLGKLSGRLPDVRWRELYQMSRSRVRFNLSELAETKNPYEAIRNPYVSAGDVGNGQKQFLARCAICHGPEGAGGSHGPALRNRRMRQGSSDWTFFRTISYGIQGTGMPANAMEWTDAWKVVAYVRSITVDGPSEAAHERVAVPPVSYEDIATSPSARGDWLTYSGSYDSQRFSTNKQIDANNVDKLRLLWAKQCTTTERSIETSPLVVGNLMFVTLPPSVVEALDADTGTLVWEYEHVLPAKVSPCCGIVNRGLAVLDKTLFLGTLDGHLIALDDETGHVLWDVTVADPAAGYSITGAPLALKTLVVTGVAGGELEARGFLSARDPATGREVWRLDTVAGGGETPDTWSGNAKNARGAPTWLTGSYDVKSKTLFWPTGNPSPNFNGDARLGDNLYTNSVLSIDPSNGALKWYFQFMPHDAFDWDATEIVVLLNGRVHDADRRLLAQANRNGFFYLLDATTGKLLLAKAFAKQTWASGTDALGRPTIDPRSYPSEQGTAVYPGVGGGANWQSSSFSPDTGLFYVPFMDWGGVFYKLNVELRPEGLVLGGSFQYFPSQSSEASVAAIDPLTGEIRWQYRNRETNVGGLLSTAGGVVFGSQGQTFFALDAATGRPLWRVATGGRTVAAPVTFSVHDKQRVTVAAGHDLLTFGL